MNSDLRLLTSDYEQEQERCIRASSFLRHSSFVRRHSSVLYCCVRAAENSHRQGPEVCPSRQARDFEAVTGLTMPCSRMEGAGKPRHRSQNPRGEGESAGSDRIKAFGVETSLTSAQYGRSRGSRVRDISASQRRESLRCAGGRSTTITLPSARCLVRSSCAP
jgi:hypothetical protein